MANTLYDEDKYKTIEALRQSTIDSVFPLYSFKNVIYVTGTGEPSTYDPGDY